MVYNFVARFEGLVRIRCMGPSKRIHLEDTSVENVGRDLHQCEERGRRQRLEALKGIHKFMTQVAGQGVMQKTVFGVAPGTLHK